MRWSTREILRQSFNLTFEQAAEKYEIPVAWVRYWATGPRKLPHRHWDDWGDCVYEGDLRVLATEPRIMGEAAKATGERVPIRPEAFECLMSVYRDAFEPVEGCDNRWSHRLSWLWVDRDKREDAAVKGLIRIPGTPEPVEA